MEKSALFVFKMRKVYINKVLNIYIIKHCITDNWKMQVLLAQHQDAQCNFYNSQCLNWENQHITVSGSIKKYAFIHVICSHIQEIPKQSSNNDCGIFMWQVQEK